MTTLAAIRARCAVHPVSGCHLWLGSTSQGYGQLRHRGRVTRAHRVACELAHGAPKSGEVARHSDTCVSRACCNPDHLRWGDERDNSRDRASAAVAGGVRRQW